MSRPRTRSAALLLVALSACAGVARAAPTESGRLDLHPGNPHYLVFRGRPIVLITSGEHYGAVLNLDFDYGKYLSRLQADGMMLTRTFSGAELTLKSPPFERDIALRVVRVDG